MVHGWEVSCQGYETKMIAVDNTAGKKSQTVQAVDVLLFDHVIIHNRLIKS